MKTKVVREDGTIVREGTIRMGDSVATAFGIPITDWFRAGSVVLSAVIIGTTLWNNMNSRVSLLENAISTNNKVNVAFIDYVKNADNFNSTVYHTRFLNGAPVDSSFEVGSSIQNETYKHKK